MGSDLEEFAARYFKFSWFGHQPLFASPASLVGAWNGHLPASALPSAMLVVPPYAWFEAF
jgi:hypothetical protein